MQTVAKTTFFSYQRIFDIQQGQHEEEKTIQFSLA